MEYEQLAKGYHYGLQKIYELVINNNPCYAYLMKSNSLVDQKLVMCHVYGHCDFFKNNFWFSQTSRKMYGRDGQRRQPHPPAHGPARCVEAVEEFIDCCLSIEDLIDVHSLFINRFDSRDKYDFQRPDEEETADPVARFRSKDYMQGFINPPQVLAAEAKRRDDERKQQEHKFPAQPQRDVMLFLLEHRSRSNPWQGRRAVDHPRRGVLLRPAGADQDHERGLGQLLALQHG